jgi:hypothetical protein
MAVKNLGAPKGLGKKEFVAPSMEEELRGLTYLVEMMNTPGWKAWVALIEGELRMIENWSWRVGGPMPKMASTSQLIAKLMDEMGTTWPANEAEMFRLWGQYRVVVNYFRSKLAWLESRVDRVEELKKALLEREMRRREKEKDKEES